MCPLAGSSNEVVTFVDEPSLVKSSNVVNTDEADGFATAKPEYSVRIVSTQVRKLVPDDSAETPVSEIVTP